MPEYLSPGVYVEEVPSAVKPIAGVSTSTAGFIGLVPDALPIPPTMVKTKKITKEQVDGNKTTFDLDDYPVVTTSNTYKVLVDGQPAKAAQLKNDATTGKSQLVFPAQYPPQGTALTVSYKYAGAGDVATEVTDEAIPADKVTGETDTFDLIQGNKVLTDQPFSLKANGVQVPARLQPKGARGPIQVVITSGPKAGAEISVDYTTGPRVGQQIGTWNGTDKKFKLPTAPVVTDSNSFKVQVGDSVVTSSLENRVDDQGNTVAYATITGEVPATVTAGTPVTADYISFQIFKTLVAVGQTKLCTNFTEYKNAFGDFTLDADHRKLTQAVYGFFNNGGTRCYVSRITGEADMDAALKAFELVDDIAIVAAPGLSTDNIRSKLVAHCRNMGDRFAILDGPEQVTDFDALTQGSAVPGRSDYAAWYFPWITVFDPASQKYENNPKGTVSVPPSGHIAGIYARVDNERGVHKAPANETILGALDVTQRLSKAHQDGLNPKGVNCIRVLNGNILVWGARTIGGDANADVKYINVRRTLLFLRKSIDEGTQWVVFEPNSPALWQKITRNVTAFLTNVWRSGALFGNTPQEAFYVKCDKETNPQSGVNNGQVVTEIGVAIVRPAEFVIFRISQMAGPGA